MFVRPRELVDNLILIPISIGLLRRRRWAWILALITNSFGLLALTLQAGESPTILVKVAFFGTAFLLVLLIAAYRSYQGN